MVNEESKRTERYNPASRDRGMNNSATVNSSAKGIIQDSKVALPVSKGDLNSTVLKPSCPYSLLTAVYKKRKMSSALIISMVKIIRFIPATFFDKDPEDVFLFRTNLLFKKAECLWKEQHHSSIAVLSGC